MKDLIEALTIFMKYTGPEEHNPTHCEHDVLMVVGVKKSEPSKADKKRLEELSFTWDDQYDCYTSFRFGSA